MAVEEFPGGTTLVPCGRGAPRGVICTYATGGHRELASISRAASIRYGSRWGWDVVTTDDPDLSEGRPPSWGKIRLMQRLLDDYELVWWIDADALIVDDARDLLADLDLSAGPVWLAAHPQGRDESASVPNFGIVVIRRSVSASRLLDAVWERVEFVDHNWWENAALLDLLGYDLQPPYPIVRSSAWLDLVSPLDLAWNVVQGYIDHPSPAIHHHARADHDDAQRRIDAMRRDLDVVEQSYPAG